MSVPHLDTRYFDKRRALLFGPFATFSTKFLKHGSYFDLPASVTLDNFRPMMAVGWDNFDLVEYLAGQLMMSDEDRLKALREYLPGARAEDWRLWQAGQRVQIIKRDPDKGGVLKLGTEIVASKDGSIAALLGASPGASTAPAIMLNLLKTVFPKRLATPAWQDGRADRAVLRDRAQRSSRPARAGMGADRRCAATDGAARPRSTSPRSRAPPPPASRPTATPIWRCNRPHVEPPIATPRDRLSRAIPGGPLTRG